MKTRFLILCVVSAGLIHDCDAQNVGGSANSRSGKPADPPSRHPARNTHVSPTPVVKKSQVTIATNEDCTIAINGKDYGSLLKGKPRTIPLDYNSYHLEASHPSTPEKYVLDFEAQEARTGIQLDVSSFVRAQKIIAGSLATARRDSLKKADSISQALRRAEEEHNHSKTPEATVLEAFTSSMVPVSGGHFQMGNNVGATDEEPVHYVTIGQMQVGKYEVTQKQWQLIMGKNPSMNKGCDDCPVENISFEDVASFLTKLNNLGGPNKFRLPTEAEWEYFAYKGGSNKDLKGSAWYGANSGQSTHKVGTKAPNALGLYDVFGNVSEWCSDWYGFNTYKKNPVDNPTGPLSGPGKVVRGGSYDDAASALRLSRRSAQNPGLAKGTTGLRLVMVPK